MIVEERWRCSAPVSVEAQLRESHGLSSKICPVCSMLVCACSDEDREDGDYCGGSFHSSSEDDSDDFPDLRGWVVEEEELEALSQ